MIWIIMFVMASAVSTIALLPASALLLRTQPFRRGILFAGLYAAFWLGLLWLVVLVGRHQGLFRTPPQAVLVGVSCLIISFATTSSGAIIGTRGQFDIPGRIFPDAGALNPMRVCEMLAAGGTSSDAALRPSFCQD